MTTTQSNLATTPLRSWPPEALMAEAKRAARFWSNNPAFIAQNGGLFKDIEDRRSEIITRVLDYLQKKPTDDSVNQITLFHEIARYCQSGIIQDSYSIPSDKFDAEDSLDEDVGHREKAIDLTVEQREEDRIEKLQALLHRIGVAERDFVLFDSSISDFVESTGLSERAYRTIKSRRKNEIFEKIKSLKLDGDLIRLAPALRGSILFQS